MLFTSIEFFWLFAFTFVLYYAPWLNRHQVLLLIIASFTFYSFNNLPLLLLLVGSIAINAITAYAIQTGVGSKRAWAWFGVVSNLCILAFFKYSGLLYQTFIAGLDTNGIAKALTAIPLPIGISFFTFQGISLLVDTYRSDPAVEKPSKGGYFRDVAFFIAFFPQLIAGPIMKARDFLPQIGAKRFDAIRWEAAFRALAIGYFLKVVIANNLNEQTFWMAYPYFEGMSSLTLAAMLFGYSMQIFADFAGYSLIAIGLAELFGYRLMANFDFPYISRSFSEFWRRWHISLSTWLKEYLYFPLGGNRVGRARTYFNLMTVMVLGGLWHGAAWSYAVWGAWHGLALATERFIKDMTGEQPDHPVFSALKMGFVFLFVTVGWLLFKLPDFQHVLLYLQALMNNTQLASSWGLIASIAMLAMPVIMYHAQHLLRRQVEVPLARIAPYAYGAMLFLLLTNAGPDNAFIYFQF